jgi:hypothetical protein
MLFLTLRNVTSVKNFSYNLVICNSRNIPIRKIGKLFYSEVFKRFVLYVDLALLYLVFRKGIRIDQFFFFTLSKFTGAGLGMHIYNFSKLLRFLS